MIFDFSASPAKQWQQLHQFKIQLHRIARVSVMTSPDERDALIKSTLAWLHAATIDAISGGFYQRLESGEGSYHIDSFNNAILAEALLVAEKVVLQGEMQHYAIGLLRNLHQQLFRTERGSVIGKLTYTKSRLPFRVSGERLLRHLEPLEISLLTALLTQKVIKTGEYFYICYRNDLQRAAEFCGMHFKQAQIIESSLRGKLFELQEKSYQHVETEQTSDHSVVANSQCLCALVQLHLWHQDNQFSEFAYSLAANLFGRLQTRHEPQNRLNISEIVEISYALLDYQQLDFKFEYIVEIERVLAEQLQKTGLDLSSSLREKLHISLQLLSHFLPDVPSLADKKFDEPDDVSHSDTFMRITVLETGMGALGVAKRQEYFTQYNPTIRVLSR